MNGKVDIALAVTYIINEHGIDLPQNPRGKMKTFFVCATLQEVTEVVFSLATVGTEPLHFTAQEKQ